MSASARRKIVEQYQTIEQLQAKVAELEAEVERTNDAFEQEHKACHDLIEKVIPNINKQLLSTQAENARLKAAVEYAETIRVENIAYFEKQLAISQLRETQLRKALEAVIKVHGYKSGIPVEAISTQASTEALDQYVAEKVREAGKFDGWKTNPYTKVLETSIEQLTKQRDLAVEALEWAADVLPPNDPGEFGGCDCPVCRALEAIKESEAK